MLILADFFPILTHTIRTKGSPLLGLSQMRCANTAWVDLECQKVNLFASNVQLQDQPSLLSDEEALVGQEAASMSRGDGMIEHHESAERINMSRAESSEVRTSCISRQFIITLYANQNRLHLQRMEELYRSSFVTVKSPRLL